MNSIADRLRPLHPCAEALEWVRPYRSARAAWAASLRADWMLWLAGQTCGHLGSPAHRRVVLAACACARTALPRWEAVYPADRRPHVALDTAEAWARGGRGAPSLTHVRHTALAVARDIDAIVRMTGTHPAALAAYAAYDAVVAAYAAYTSTAASVAVSDAATALAYAAGAPSSHVAAAQELVLAGMADLVRGIIPRCPRLPARAGQ